MATNSQGDVLLFQTPDDGEMAIAGGEVEMGGGLRTAVYVSLFGGNEDDSGADKGPYSWWGNIDTELYIRSETQYLLDTLHVTANNLKRIEAAVARDCAWLISSGVAQEVAARAIIPEYNAIKITLTVDGIAYEYTHEWSARA